MLALIFTQATVPIPIGSRLSARWRMFAGMIRRPLATSWRMSSGSSASRSATRFMASVTIPRRADANWVTAWHEPFDACLSIR